MEAGPRRWRFFHVVGQDEQDGPHTLLVSLEDAAGNRTTTSPGTIYYDNLAPALDFNGQSSSAAVVGSSAGARPASSMVRRRLACWQKGSSECWLA